MKPHFKQNMPLIRNINKSNVWVELLDFLKHPGTIIDFL